MHNRDVCPRRVPVKILPNPPEEYSIRFDTHETPGAVQSLRYMARHDPEAAPELYHIQISTEITLDEPDLGALIQPPKEIGLDGRSDCAARVDEAPSAVDMISRHLSHQRSDERVAQHARRYGLPIREANRTISRFSQWLCDANRHREIFGRQGRHPTLGTCAVEQ